MNGRTTGARPAMVGLALLLTAAQSAAAEPTAQVVEFHNAALNHYFVTAFPEEAAALDAGTPVAGWTRTGVAWKAWKSAGDGATAVPVCRFHGTPGVGPNSHFYTADAAECASVRQNPDWTFEGIAFHVDVPKGGACGAGTTPVYRSFYQGATVAQSNHRFLTDLTMHQNMAGSSILEGAAMCAPLATTQKRADIVRLLEQATFGPNDALVAHVERSAFPPSSTSSSRRPGRGIRAASTCPRARGHLLRDRSQSAHASATTTRCSSCRPTSSATRSRATTSCASAWRSRCRRSSSRPASTSTSRTAWRTTSRSSSTARSATSRTCSSG